MIFLTFLEIYLINNAEINSDINNDKNYIKEIIIIFTFGSLIYLLLHQANQLNDNVFKFSIYNKILCMIMIIDIIICLYYVSKHLVNYGMIFI